MYTPTNRLRILHRGLSVDLARLRLMRTEQLREISRALVHTDPWLETSSRPMGGYQI
jgi:hypothetical protein